MSLPPSAYTDPQIFLRERQALFNSSWLLACHTSEIAAPGDYLTLNIGGEPIVLLRNNNGALGAFFNICIHRGFPLFDKASGHMEDSVTCGYHGWRYSRQGTLIDPKVATNCRGLKAISIQEFCGFVFVSIRPNPSPVSERFHPWAQEFANYGFEKLVPLRSKTFVNVLPLNWKLFMENTLEGQHVVSVHPGLNDLIGYEYRNRFSESIFQTVAALKKSPSKSWSERMYQSVIARVDRPAEWSEEWTFYFLFPNVQISIYPEQIFYLQAIPLGVDKTMVRGRFLHFGRSSRLTRLAQYLNLRVGRKIYREDLPILKGLQRSFESQEFGDGLSLTKDDEVIRQFQDRWTRQLARH